MDFTFILNNIEFFLFIGILTIILTINRKRLQILGSFPFLYMLLYKTKTGLKFMKNFSKKYPKLVKQISFISIIVGILGILLSTAFMIYQLIFIVKNNITRGGGFVLPIKTTSSAPIFYVPFWYWIIALSILVMVHEFAHGIISERWKVKVKSSGFAFLGIIFPIIPAAFVEPDEKSLKKKTWWQKIAVYGAGSLSNFIFGIIFLIFLLTTINPIIDNISHIDGIKFNNVMNQSQLKTYNIKSGTIYGINNYFDYQNITKKLTNLTKNETLKLYLKDITYENGTKELKGIILNVQTFHPNETKYKNKGMLGISKIEPNLKFNQNSKNIGKILLKIKTLLYWLIILNIGIGIMNLLPIWITDGGQILFVLLSLKFNEKKSRIIYNLTSFFILILIILTIWPSILFKLLTVI